MVDTLYRKIRTGGLALVGPDACWEALERDQVDVLVLAREMPNRSLKEELVRLAAQNDCQVEVVNDSAILMGYGGAGCLLRYLLPEQYIIPNRERMT